MADIPDTIVLKRDRDLPKRSKELWARLRPLLEGYPLVVVQEGKVIEANLRRERITVVELAEAARLEQIASIDDVDWAILETSGQISFIPKKSS